MEKNILEDKVKISSYALDDINEFDLPETTSWLVDITKELEKDFDDEDRKGLQEAYIRAHLTVKKVQNSEIGDHLTIRGHIVGSFSQPCVRCLIPTLQEVDAEFASVYINPIFKDAEEYADMISIYSDGEQMDLYFHDKGTIDLRELVYEQIQINSEELPLHDPNCKGLCPVCGANKNLVDCGH